MVVLTGAAGTGKSALMRHVLGGLGATGCNPRVVVAQSSALMKDCAPLCASPAPARPRRTRWHYARHGRAKHKHKTQNTNPNPKRDGQTNCWLRR